MHFQCGSNYNGKQSLSRVSVGLVRKVARYVLKQEQNQSQYEDIWLNDADIDSVIGCKQAYTSTYAKQ